MISAPRTATRMQDFFSPLIEHAIELAAQWHAGTYRKGIWRDFSFTLPEGRAPRIPVMAHLTAVATAVQRAGWEDACVAAAFLHDILEDPNRYGQRLDYATLERLIGPEVAGLVLQVSERKLDEEGNLRGWKERKLDYLEGLKHHSPQAAAISLADKVHNLWSINQSLARGIDVFKSEGDRRALRAGASNQRWFYRAVLDATRHHSDERLLPMQRRLDEELERFEGFFP